MEQLLTIIVFRAFSCLNMLLASYCLFSEKASIFIMQNKKMMNGLFRKQNFVMLRRGTGCSIDMFLSKLYARRYNY